MSDDTELYKRQCMQLLTLFSYSHLPPDLQSVSKQFAELAETLHDLLPASYQKVWAYRLLIQAKDAAVRGCLP